MPLAFLMILFFYKEILIGGKSLIDRCRPPDGRNVNFRKNDLAVDADVILFSIVSGKISEFSQCLPSVGQLVLGPSTPPHAVHNAAQQQANQPKAHLPTANTDIPSV